MKTLELEIALIKHLNHVQNLIVPNVSDWSTILNFEADLLMLTKSGYANAFELKITKSDLRNDVKKKHIENLERVMYNNKTAFEHYYSPLKTFSYVVPEKLKESALKQIPAFCGLLVAKHNKYIDGKIDFEMIKPAKTLFKKKWTDKERYALARLGTMRILTLKENLNKNK